MVEMIGLTGTLAFFIGLYFTAASIGLLLDPAGTIKFAQRFADEPLTAFLGGFAALAAGAAIVATHIDMSSLLAGFVTVVGFVALVEAALLFAFREKFVALFMPLMGSQGLIRMFGAVTLVIGGALMFAALNG